MGGDFIGSDLVKLSTGYDFLKGVLDVALGEFSAPIKSIQKYAGVYFLCEETKRLLPHFRHSKENVSVVRCDYSEADLRNVTCSADRCGYLIYQSDIPFQIR